MHKNRPQSITRNIETNNFHKSWHVHHSLFKRARIDVFAIRLVIKIQFSKWKSKIFIFIKKKRRTDRCPSNHEPVTNIHTDRDARAVSSNLKKNEYSCVQTINSNIYAVPRALSARMQGIHTYKYNIRWRAARALGLFFHFVFLSFFTAHTNDVN